MDVVAVVVDRDRLDELPALGLRELREVIELHHAARRPGLAHDGPSDRPLVEGVPAASLDQAERPRQVGVAEDAVHPGWLAVGEERVHGVGVRPQVGRERPPVVSHALVDGEALRGVPARRLQDLPEAHRAEALEDRVPPGDSARDGHRVDPAAGDLVDAQRLVEVLRRPPLRRPPAGLQAVQLLVPGRPHEREHVTAETRGHRLDHTGRGGGGDRRVDRVATSNRMRSAVAVISGWLVAATPLRASTSERDCSGYPWGRLARTAVTLLPGFGTSADGLPNGVSDPGGACATATADTMARASATRQEDHRRRLLVRNAKPPAALPLTVLTRPSPSGHEWRWKGRTYAASSRASSCLDDV